MRRGDSTRARARRREGEDVVERIGYDGIRCGHDESGDDVEMNAPGRDEGPGGYPKPPNEPAIDRTNL